ncbi:roquin-1 [Zootermopsis nevadensis]|uniref:RING-type E3 ubiquitin transferase n=1 Tax=Zootermopsis nevadensis TaxID=136037 RepID=A0A067RJ86_ZOONE|nr:roquin-1 [Zootermopsis nevadensis]KDR20501.1 Roquin [Zootermopsis nevadensis]
MPIQAPQWTEFLSCPVCCNEFDPTVRSPISLGCGHTVCKTCLSNLHRKQCPFDQTSINTDIENLPINFALLQLVGTIVPETEGNGNIKHLTKEDLKSYLQAKKCIEELALYLKPFSSSNGSGGTSVLSRPMQRKLVSLINCQLMEEEGRSRAMRAARSLGERTVTELILQHQNPQQLSANLWAAVRARGCQFLGPAMQEEVLKLVLLALEDGTALSRKVLVMFVVQRLEPHFPQASKTSIGHVVQLLYRASCFKVSKREGDSSLMQLKEEFRTYEALRREHDAQIVQIATEAGLRIAPDQWSALLYGDMAHKSHMQSIIDKLQSPQSFAQSVQELVIALQRTGDPGNLSVIRLHLELLAAVDPSPESSPPAWYECCGVLEAVRIVVTGLVDYIQHHGSRKLQEPGYSHNAKYKISMCRDLTIKGNCPRGTNCTFAHSEEELEKYRAKNKKANTRNSTGVNKSQEMGNKEGQCGEFHNNDKVFVQTDDMLYSTTTPTITPSAFENSVLKEGYLTSSPSLQVPPPVPTAIPQPGLEYRSYTTPYPSADGCQSASVYQPSQQQMFAPTPGTFTPDIYSAAPHNMLLSSGGQTYATSSQPDYGSPVSPAEHRPVEIAHSGNTWEQNSPSSQQNWRHSQVAGTSATKRVAPKSLAALQQRKQEIISQLEKVVGKSAASAISSSASSQARATSVFPSTDNLANTATYSIWTSGGILHAGRGGSSQLSHITTTGHPSTLYRSDSVLADDEFIPFDPPIVSKYGPISRMSKTVLRPNSSVQASASFGDGTISTPMVRRPVPAASPVASWYLNATQGYPAAIASGRHIMAPPSAGLGDGYITIGHGILDPPQLFMQNKPADCSTKDLLVLADTQKLGLKQQLRNLEKQLNDLKLATQGPCAALSEGEKLTHELQIIEQGIQEKEKELRLNHLVSASLASTTITAIGWKRDGTVNWGLKSFGEYRSDDEDTYEAGIANDMRELEMRLEFELEEQEKRWSSEEESGKK